MKASTSSPPCRFANWLRRFNRSFPPTRWGRRALRYRDFLTVGLIVATGSFYR